MQKRLTPHEAAAEPQTSETDEAQEIPKAPALTMTRFGLADEHRNVWRITVPVETMPEQLLDEGF